MLLTLKRKNKKGFTLIELIVVVAILAILAAIAVPSFIGITAKAEKGVDIANAAALAGAINVANSMNSGATQVFANGTLTAWPTFPAGYTQLEPQISGSNAADITAKKGRAAVLVTITGGVATVNTTNP